MVSDTCMRTCLIRKSVDHAWIEVIVGCATSAPNVTIFAQLLNLKQVPVRWHDEAVACYNGCNR